MPRQSRIDFPGLLEHVIARGIEHRPIVADDKEREHFVGKLQRFLEDTATGCYAWALPLGDAGVISTFGRTRRFAPFWARQAAPLRNLGSVGHVSKPRVLKSHFCVLYAY